jgi:hypothetical protein
LNHIIVLFVSSALTLGALGVTGSVLKFIVVSALTGFIHWDFILTFTILFQLKFGNVLVYAQYVIHPSVDTANSIVKELNHIIVLFVSSALTLGALGVTGFVLKFIVVSALTGFIHWDFILTFTILFQLKFGNVLVYAQYVIHPSVDTANSIVKELNHIIVLFVSSALTLGALGVTGFVLKFIVVDNHAGLPQTAIFLISNL